MTLRSYLVQLASNPDALTAFVANPRRAATDAGLAPDDQSVLFSGDQQKIYLRVANPPESVPACEGHAENRHDS